MVNFVLRGERVMLTLYLQLLSGDVWNVKNIYDLECL